MKNTFILFPSEAEIRKKKSLIFLFFHKLLLNMLEALEKLVGK